MSIELVAIDLDDTLLDSEWKIAESSLEAIRQVQEKGIMVTLATGRMFRSALPYARQLKVDIPLITYQGALVKNSLSEEVLYYEPLPRKLATEVMKLFKEQGIFFQSYFNDCFCIESWSPEAEYYAELSGIKPLFYEDLIAVSREQDTPKILATVFDERLILSMEEELNRRFGEELYITRSKPVFLEVMSRYADKGQALKMLAQHYSIPREKVLAMGDSYNDLAMIKWAGIGVAMGNAPEVVKEAADYLAPSNEDEGVAQVLHELVLNKIYHGEPIF
ncbi:MAG: Cof-type HAD-IIB family hydrolase [Syntrophomonas sp.]|uniref:Cof-type HAD-IIB family hydrolase n=1 Tax=Syntrophomonas sp. TaxID=2053627 RepID=UPI00262D6AF5|nr:Cof-type HAD-IIB family hydrolase [Syntrophomonas sp.]MDD4626485.1 Cof-type HAD-IIB family hydrolase [Syntrophomonas sp.]